MTRPLIPDKNLFMTEPLFVSWGGKTSAGSWGLDFNFNFDSKSPNIQDINQWYLDCFKRSLKSFEYLARVWSISINVPSQSEVLGETIEWEQEKGESYNRLVVKLEP